MSSMHTTLPDRHIIVEIYRLELSSWSDHDVDPTTSRFGLLGKPRGHGI